MSQLAGNTTFTADELLRMRDDPRGFELVHGHLLEKTASRESSKISGQIIYLLKLVAAKTLEAEVYNSELGYQCFKNDPNHIRKPDVSLVRSERLSALGNVGYMPIPADLAAEVISKNDLEYDVTSKVEEYLANGFRSVWVVDPQSKLVTIHRADGSVTKLRENDTITGESALPTFQCKVAEFFV